MRHVYVHVPFCRRRCSYCDFSIAVRRTVPSQQFVDAVTAEYTLRREGGEWDAEPLVTLYLGGGTPSLLDANELARLVTLLAAGSDPTREITIEANPEDVTAERALLWARAGVTRVSLGVQSLNQRVLEWMHRPHGPQAPARAVHILRSAGIASVSVDLIFALPADLERNLDDDLDRLLALEPDHVSAYGLTVEPRTPLDRWIKRGTTKPADEERYGDEFLRVDARLTREGFDHYEVSNYGKGKNRARHNSAYWTGAPYAGLGPAAHRYMDGTRAWNVPQWTDYAKHIAQGADPTADREVLTADQQALERVYLGLRTSSGLATDVLPMGQGSLLAKMASQGWLESSSRVTRLTPLGWLRLDEIVSVLTTSARSG